MREVKNHLRRDARLETIVFKPVLAKSVPFGYCLLEQFHIARAMAEGARQLTRSTYALSVTGIAGPDGGTPDKPVGTVCFALAAADIVHRRRYQLWGNREWVKLLSSQVALDWLRRHLLGLSPTESGILRR